MDGFPIELNQIEPLGREEKGIKKSEAIMMGIIRNGV